MSSSTLLSVNGRDGLDISPFEQAEQGWDIVASWMDICFGPSCY
jgi:hypothetical protein